MSFKSAELRGSITECSRESQKTDCGVSNSSSESMELVIS